MTDRASQQAQLEQGIAALGLSLPAEAVPRLLDYLALLERWNAAYNLTVSNSSSAKYALTVMTVVAVLFLPLVLLYQGWSYHVFRARVGRGKAPADQHPPAAAAATTEPTG